MFLLCPQVGAASTPDAWAAGEGRKAPLVASDGSSSGGSDSEEEEKNAAAPPAETVASEKPGNPTNEKVDPKRSESKAGSLEVSGVG